MRILLVSDYSTLTGGVEIYLDQLRRLLREAGHEAVLFSSTVGAKAARKADLECWGSRQRHLNRLLQTFNPFAWAGLERAISQFKPEVVHLNLILTQLSPSVLMLLARLPTVYTAHMYRMICPLGQKLLPDRSICQDKAGWACLRNGCLPPSLWLIDRLQWMLLDRYRDRIDAVWANSRCTTRMLESSGIEVDRVQNYFLTASCHDPPFPEGCPTAGFIGRLVAEKGVDVLLRAMQRVRERLPTARLLIAGEGKERERLQELGRQLGLEESVEFLGYLPPQRSHEFWPRIQALAVPSLWAEPFGLVATEAMAAGRAVIATRGGGLEESVVEGETGFLVDPGDVQQLADRLSGLLTDPRRCREMGQRGFQLGRQKFDNERCLVEHIEGYRGVISAGRTRCAVWEEHRVADIPNR